MYDIRQFKPVLYFLVILGLTGFALAAEEPALWVLAVGGVMLNVWLIRTGRFTPMPRWLSNGIVLLASAYVGIQWAHVTITPILLIGQFLVLLQLVKLFEQRANRDYVQLIVLSSLLMVAAAISTASLAFGVILLVYVYLALYCFLLFHLKVEADKAKAAQTLPSDQLNEATLRQDQRYLPRSMRRLTALVAVISLFAAVVVFLLFPRGSGAGVLGQLQLHPTEVLTGFSDDVQFNQVAKITQNMDPVATVEVWRGDHRVESGSLRLRGSTVNLYSQGRNGEWTWTRTGIMKPFTIDGDTTFRDTIGAEEPTPDGGDWRQVVSLEPIGAKSLFALAGVSEFTPRKDAKIAYHHTDETLQRTENFNVPLRYEVVSHNRLSSPLRTLRLYKPPQSVEISDAIRKFARDAEVSGTREGLPQGQSLAALRLEALPVTEFDEQIAQNIEKYFKTKFSYTLDLTDSADKFEGKDPLSVFVTETKAGHCEYFAGAMTLACQSLGLQARMVVGFVTDEFNSVGGYFQVRQAHAHTWVEVLTLEHGWVTFDPTSGRELAPNEKRSTWQRVKHLFDWMEYKWANAVVAYDGSRRENLIQKVDNSLVRSAYRSSERMYKLKRWWRHLHLLDQAEFWSISSKLLAGVITLMSLVIVAAVAWYLVEQRRIRRRAERIGLGALPVPDQIRLAKQLGFFEDMMDVLRRHRIERPAHLTPREFSRGLTFLPVEAYDAIEGLTRVFYRVRYGNARVQPGQRRRLEVAVERLGEALKPPPAA